MGLKEALEKIETMKSKGETSRATNCELLAREARVMFEKLKHDGFTEDEAERFMCGNGFIPPTFIRAVHCANCGWMPERWSDTKEVYVLSCTWCESTEFGEVLGAVFNPRQGGKLLRHFLLKREK